MIAAGVLAASGAQAATPAQIVAKLNAQRAANGIPAGITLDPVSTRGCEHHIRYEELNGIPWTHEEVPGRPGFTKDGKLAASTGLQAYYGSFDQVNPYENAPLHLAALLQPHLSRIGAFERGRRSCVVPAAYARELTANAVYTYPGGGRYGVPTSQTVHGEAPNSPGDMVGLPQGTTTGPTIYVLAAGPWTGELPLRLTAAHLISKRGPVAIRVVDPARHAAIRPYVFPGVFFVIPVKPLSPGTVHTATVTVRSARGTTRTKRWQFATAD